VEKLHLLLEMNMMCFKRSLMSNTHFLKTLMKMLKT